MIETEKNNNDTKTSLKSAIVNLFITLYLGLFGVHKFIEKNTKMGLIYLFTMGIFGLGWIYDIILSIMKVFKAIKNRKNNNDIVWIISIYNIGVGICLNDSFTISNILFILAGLCIMPPISNKLISKTNIYTKNKKWIIFTFLTIIAYGTVLPNILKVNPTNQIQSIKEIESQKVENKTKKESNEQVIKKEKSWLSDFSGVVLTNDGIKVTRTTDFEIIYEETTGKRLEDGTYLITGKIKQNIEGSYTGIMPTLNLLDKNGKKVRETTGWITYNYEGNNIWSFTVQGNDADGIVTNFELISCYGY